MTLTNTRDLTFIQIHLVVFTVCNWNTKEVYRQTQHFVICFGPS